MEILIFSDSHGRVEGMRRAILLQPKAPDLILHLGDGAGDTEYLRTRGAPVLSVRGNCDWFTVASMTREDLLLEEQGHKIFMAHGHRFDVKSGTGGILAHAVRLGADIVLFGHTHEPLERCIPAGETVGGVTLERPVYLFNPGSVGRGDCSFGTLSLTPSAVLFSHGTVNG